MENIFYSLAVLAMLYEITKFQDLEEYKKYIDNRNIVKLDSHKTLDQLELCYGIWLLIGLFTSQWILFSCIIVLGIIKKNTITWIKYDAIISFILLALIVINKFHLHI